jgi:hypothetical protein
MYEEGVDAPSRVESIALRSGLFLIEYFSEPGGKFTVQARGPLSPDATSLGEPQHHYRIVAAAEGSSEDVARTELWKLLRALGEFEWATRAPPGAEQEVCLTRRR